MWFAPQMVKGFTLAMWSGGLPRVRIIFGNPLMIMFMLFALYLWLLAKIAIWLAVMVVIWGVQVLCLPSMVLTAMGVKPAGDPDTMPLPKVVALLAYHAIFPQWWRDMVHNQLQGYGTTL